MRRQGRIVEWNDARGFGFVLWHGGDERAFAHVNSFAERGVRPSVGDVVTYQASTDARGRVAASDIRYAAMADATRSRPPRNDGRRAPAGRQWPGALLLAALLAGAGGWYHHDRRGQRLVDPAAAATVVARSAAPPAAAAGAAGFACSGKQHCSQMSSCAEARFYLAHCPDTRIDGDGDGEPCEDLCRAE